MVVLWLVIGGCLDCGWLCLHLACGCCLGHLKAKDFAQGLKAPGLAATGRLTLPSGRGLCRKSEGSGAGCYRPSNIAFRLRSLPEV